MNCEEYRYAVTVDPAFGGGVQHAAVCADCRAYQQEMLGLNLKIARAMQIDTPPPAVPELPAIETTKVRPLRSSGPSRQAMLWYAVAATVVLGVSLSLRLSGPFASYDSLADEVIAHLDHEPGALRVTDTPVSERRLLRTVPATLARFDRDASLITYAQSCVINGKRVPHLVIQGERGPVTILLLPEEKIDAVTPLEGVNVQGVILPVGNGSVAIIGDREEALGPLQDTVLQAVTWTI